MKTFFVKILAVSICAFSALLLNSSLLYAQEDNQVIDRTDNQVAEQHKQAGMERNHSEMQQKQHFVQQKQHGEQRKNIEAQRIAFITQELNLTPAEAKVFWPVYNEYDSKRHDMKKSFKNMDDLHKAEIEKLTEKEASQILDNQITEAQKLLDLRKEYHAKFKSVLPAVKVLKLYGAEREFQKMLIDKLRQNHSKQPVNKK